MSMTQSKPPRNIGLLTTFLGALMFITLLGIRSFAGPSETESFSHSFITQWKGTATCLECHEKEAKEVHGALHYQWLGDTPFMTSGPALQGKLEVSVNSYCINITGNWNGCKKCHAGLGSRPEPIPSRKQLENIDCLLCHQKEYKRKLVNGRFVPDTDRMNITMLEAAQSVHLPERANCLQCHALGGGGDNFKRGDLALAHSSTADKNFDVHMATTGADFACQSCHVTSHHRIAGKGSDLRPTELSARVDCSSCHVVNGDSPHDSQDINRHLGKVSCQACHIPFYARNAFDTAATEETETSRDWLKPQPKAGGLFEPLFIMGGNMVPKYRWWNGFSTNYVLFDDAHRDLETGKFPTSRPEGGINNEGSKIYPFKYKTALQPLATRQNQLIALDTSVYFQTGDPDAAVRSGLRNMGYNESDPYNWVYTDTYQLITHEVPPKSSALRCDDCHGSNTRINLISEMGYSLRSSQQEVCAQCHKPKDPPKYKEMHDKHVKDKHYDCSWCHTFSRPERNLKTKNGPPDLTITASWYKARANSSVDLVAIIENRGVSTAKNLTVSYYVENNNTPVGTLTLPLLGPKNTTFAVLNWDPAVLGQDTKAVTMMIVVDPEDVIQESDEQNNTMQLEVPISGGSCEADLNNDGTVDFRDVQIFGSHFGSTSCESSSPCPWDQDGDGDTDGYDFALFAGC